MRSGRYDSAAFFAQQAAEFLLRLLIKLTGSRPLTRAVSEPLAYLAKALEKPVPEDVMRCAEALEINYIQARYPDARQNEYKRWKAVGCMNAVWGYVREVAGGPA